MSQFLNFFLVKSLSATLAHSLFGSRLIGSIRGRVASAKAGAGIICKEENGGKNKMQKGIGTRFRRPSQCFDPKSQQGSQSHSVQALVPIIESWAFGMQQQRVNTMQSGDNAQLAEAPAVAATAAAAAQRHFTSKATQHNFPTLALALIQ